MEARKTMENHKFGGEIEGLRHISAKLDKEREELRELGEVSRSSHTAATAATAATAPKLSHPLTFPSPAGAWCRRRTSR